jgi:hypothetical protein
MRVDGIEIRVSRTVGDPCSIASAEHGLDRSDESAGRDVDADGLALSDVHVGLAVRDDEKPSIFEPRA